MARRRKRTTTTSTSRSVGYRLGFRSGLEDRVSHQITEAGLELLYETDKIGYVVPARDSKYTPDFKLPKKGGFFYIETKGIWTVQDRAKHLLIQKQHPDLDIRFVFNQNASCTRVLPPHTPRTVRSILPVCHKVIPEAWLTEAKGATKGGCPFYSIRDIRNYYRTKTPIHWGG